MTNAGWIALLAWIVGGFPVGVAWGVWGARIQRREGHPWALPPGYHALTGWVLAPLILVGVILAGVCWALGRVIGRVERAHPSRDALERRIHELEDEMEVGR